MGILDYFRARIDCWGENWWSRTYWYRIYIESGKTNLEALYHARKHAEYANKLYMALLNRRDSRLVSIIAEADQKLERLRRKN
ncbi:hypothetical protein J4455_03815 [Candidatus Woesearchaeota archaeon]|nr:hypothetical protein [Candidatus Woesearchaeota archaeon]